MFHIVLVEPEIPSNTGNIVRTCAATGTKLHLIKPLGFELDDKHLKRAGLDYWEFSDVSIYENLDEFMQKNEGKFYFASTKSAKRYCDVSYEENAYFFFGKETKGLDEDLLQTHYNDCIRIPMKEGIRSLNLANSVAVVLFEALRQQDFKGMQAEGRLTKYQVE